MNAEYKNENEINYNQELLPYEPTNSLLAERDNDFDTYSAYGEIIDNSIQAEAKNISINIEHERKKTSAGLTEPISEVYFTDDGHGMDKEILFQCLVVGFSTRHNDRSGIGRFGVGSTKAGVHECQRIEIYSKQKKDQWYFTFLDIEEICYKKTRKGIPPPKQKNPPDKYFKFLSRNQGTLVIWKKYDRQPYGATEIINEARHWIGRTYRRFIWKGIKIKLNNKIVASYDPLFINFNNSDFLDDKKAKLIKFDPEDWPIPFEDRKEGGRKQSQIIVKMSLLHHSLRPLRFTSASGKEAKEKRIPDNTGFSIMRNDREVFFGEIPRWKPQFEEQDMWWGGEISFHAELDRCFTVKNIKRGAVPNNELKKRLIELTEPTRKQFKREVSELWQKNKDDKDTTSGGDDSSTSEAEIIAGKTKLPKNLIDKKKNLDAESRKVLEQYLKNAKEAVKTAHLNRFKSQPFTIVRESWSGSEFLDTKHLGGNTVLLYNLRHLFHQELKKIEDKLEKVMPVSKEAKDLRTLVDILLISYAKAEAMFDAQDELSAEQFIDNLRNRWGNYLTSYINQWNKEY